MLYARIELGDCISSPTRSQAHAHHQDKRVHDLSEDSPSRRLQHAEGTSNASISGHRRFVVTSPLLGLSVDEVLSTTRSVRRRLDFDRPVEPGLVEACLRLAIQAPTRSNTQAWRFVVITDSAKRGAIGDVYRRAFDHYRQQPYNAGALFADHPDRSRLQKRVMASAAYLAKNIHRAPVHLIPCLSPRVTQESDWQHASYWGSIIPAAWSFMLAARARGLGSAWTTLYLIYERDVAEILDIPYEDVQQIALLPVAHTKGVDFKPAPREPLDQVVYWNRWVRPVNS